MHELYELPEGWEWKKIDDTIVKTKNITPKNNPQSDFTYIDISSIDNETFSIVSPKTILGKDAPSRAKKEVQVNDIVFATTRPNLKNIAIAREEYNNPVASTGFCILRTNKVENKYLFFYLLSNIFYKQVEKYIRGAQYPAISDKDVKSIAIPLPPLQEQKRIVAKLDSLFAKIDQAIALHQQNIDEAEGFMGSVLNEVFGELEEKYEKLKINDIATVKGGKRVPKGFKLLEIETPYPYLRVTDFKEYGTICTKKMLYLSEDVYEIIKRYTITDEDLYITNVGNTIGKSGIIPSFLNGANLTENAVKLVYKDKKNTSNKFMYYFTKSSTFIVQMESAIKQMAVPKLAIMRLGEILTPFPPLSIQQKTVKYLDQLSQKTETLKQVQIQKMESLKALKASLLDRAFRGEL